MDIQLNENVKEWWNKNPFSYGLSKKSGSYKDVGDISDAELDINFFDRYMAKMRKNADGQIDPLMHKFIDYNFIKGKKVLDIAIGFGWSVIEMAKNGALVTGIDIAPRAVELTKKHLQLRNLAAEVMVMDAQELQFPDESFDYVHAWGCLMHMPDTQRAINEIFRVLKKGGKTSGYMYNKNSVTFWWHRWFLRGILMGKLIKYKGDIQKLVSRYGDGVTIGGCPLIKVYTPKEAAKMFEQAGFVNVRVASWGPPELLNNFPTRKTPWGKILPYSWKKFIADRWGWGMIFQADKK